MIIAAGAMSLIMLAVRLARRPRNRLIPSTGLADEARALKRNQRVRDAVYLVRGETGMSHRAAARFVRKL
ncbi:hypothetical protein [Nonomuraea longicatena]|uniref:hypothetical protein n=1 Tax=Nonomuraea longicatena TaxID=83682 RepID=UPI0031D6023B